MVGDLLVVVESCYGGQMCSLGVSSLAIEVVEALTLFTVRPAVAALDFSFLAEPPLPT